MTNYDRIKHLQEKYEKQNTYEVDEYGFFKDRKTANLLWFLWREINKQTPDKILSEENYTITISGKAIHAIRKRAGSLYRGLNIAEF